jgi:UDP-N-acetylglucosamine diphosphorylase/glucosamine-1-phosphate N-acetyltransferase
MSAAMIVLFEDEGVANCAPVAATRPAFELRYGLWNLRERVERVAPEARRASSVRPHLRACLEASMSDWTSSIDTASRVLLLNARALAGDDSLRRLWAGVGDDASAREGNALVWATVDADRAQAFLTGDDTLDDLPSAAHSAFTLAQGLWSHVRRGGQQLCEDFRELRAHGEVERRIFATTFSEGSARRELLAQTRYGSSEIAILHPGVHLVEAESIAFGAGCEVRPGVVLDASRGPIVIGPAAVIHSQSVVVGPCFIGAGAVVNPGTRLREASSVGAFCKVGGEIEDAILLDLSNKQHDGFLGHAYVGQWVNLGADTNGSDLKNNYGSVAVDFGDRKVDTGETFVGPLLGDHAKTSINTMLNTGSFVGVASNLFGGGFPPLHVPHYSWGGRESLVEYRLDKALETARTVLGRRDVEWTQCYASLLESVFEESAPARAHSLGH